MDNSLSIVILAGGRSSRMGRDKATIEIDGVPLIRRIYDVVTNFIILNRLNTIQNNKINYTCKHGEKNH